MFESKVHDWVSLAIPQTSLKKPKHAQMCLGEVTIAKTAAGMFSGHKWMSLCVTTYNRNATTAMLSASS